MMRIVTLSITVVALMLLAGVATAAGEPAGWITTGAATVVGDANTPSYAVTPTGPNALFDQIRSDHGIIRRLLIAMEREPRANRAERWAELRTVLVPHMEAEERVFYPALQRLSASSVAGYIGEEEHAAARPLFIKLDQGSFDDPRWEAQYHVLKTMLEHHATEEERRIFADAKRAMTNAQQIALYNEFMQQRQLAMESIPRRIIPTSYLED